MKRFLMGVLRPLINQPDTGLIHLLWAERDLVTHGCRRLRIERPLHVDFAAKRFAVQLLIDKDRHVSFQRARRFAFAACRNQTVSGGQDKLPPSALKDRFVIG